MRCDEIREQMADYLAGRLDATGRAAVEDHVGTCAACSEDVEMWARMGRLGEERPSAALGARVQAMIGAFEEGRTETPAAEARPWVLPRPATAGAWALASLVAGLLLGRLFWQPAAPHGELTAMRQEIRAMRQMVAVSLMQQSSASERLRGVNWSYRLERPDPEVVEALVQTLKYDTSVDVRLAAVDALRRAGQVPEVRQGLVEALARQDSPLVQLAVLDLVVELRERRAVESLQRLSRDAAADQIVRQKAEWGLRQLRGGGL